MKLLKRLFIAIGVLVLLLAGFTLYGIYEIDSLVKSGIEKYGSEAVKAQVSLGSVSVDLKKAQVTLKKLTVANPEGNIGFFSPRANVFNVGFAKKLSSSIYGGVNFKVVSENIFNLRASGIALDAGIRYVSGDQQQLKFGIALKNVGPVMKFKGDGLAQQVEYVSNGFIATLENRSASFELPSLLAIGGSYDFILSDESRLSLSASFQANSFSKDQYKLGLDYGMATEKLAFNIRGGFVYEEGLLDQENRSNALVGPTAGFSVDALVGKNQSALGVEYCSRFAGVFGIIHTLGVTISLN